jgi:antitoxin ParD1/3/4
MATMNVSLPAPMKDWVEAQVATGRYANVSDFVRDLIRDAQERQDALEEFDRLIESAEASGVSDSTIDEIVGGRSGGPSRRARSCRWCALYPRL